MPEPVKLARKDTRKFDGSKTGIIAEAPSCRDALQWYSVDNHWCSSIVKEGVGYTVSIFIATVIFPFMSFPLSSLLGMGFCYIKPQNVHNPLGKIESLIYSGVLLNASLGRHPSSQQLQMSTPYSPQAMFSSILLTSFIFAIYHSFSCRVVSAFDRDQRLTFRPPPPPHLAEGEMFNNVLMGSILPLALVNKALRISPLLVHTDNDSAIVLLVAFATAATFANGPPAAAAAGCSDYRILSRGEIEVSTLLFSQTHSTQLNSTQLN